MKKVLIVMLSLLLLTACGSKKDEERAEGTGSVQSVTCAKMRNMLDEEKDIVLVLGKGNETYEKLKDKTIYFNDEEEVYKAIKNRKKREKK